MDLKTPATRFIPFRKRDIVQMCLDDGRLDSHQQHDFQNCSSLIQALFHFEFHQRAERLKDSFSTLNPDRDTRAIKSRKSAQCDRFVKELEQLLDKANFEQVSEADLAMALSEDSLFKIKLHVDFDEFAEVLLYCRGESVRTETLPTMFGLKQRDVQFVNYDRVVIYIRFREDLDPKLAAARDIKPGSVILKLFKNVPKADLEMLFPNTAVRMRLIDKLMIGVPARGKRRHCDKYQAGCNSGAAGFTARILARAYTPIRSSWTRPHWSPSLQALARWAAICGNSSITSKTASFALYNPSPRTCTLRTSTTMPVCFIA